MIHNRYQPTLEKAIDNAGVTVVVFVAVLLVTVGIINSGMVRIVLFPEVPGDFIRMDLQMESGSAPEARNAALDRIERALLNLNDEYIAENPDLPPMISHIGSFSQGDIGAVAWVELPMVTGRPLQVSDIANQWRERVGEIPGVRELTFEDGDNFGGGAPLSFRLSGDNYTALENASKELEEHIATYAGVFDIRNSSESGAQEIKLTIKPEAEALGLTMASLGRQVRQAFYGEEAQRIQRGKDELRVMVRYPQEDRRSIADLENMRIRTPDGAEVPFESVADVSFGKGYSSIRRLNRARTITVSADIDPEIAEPGKIAQEVSDDYIPAMLSRHSGVSYGLEGSSQEEQDFMRNLMVASVAALFLIYALIAIPLRSYGQPLVIMSVIPFGMVGAVIGHLMMGKALSMFSLFGFVALSGVVVNDSLIMVDFVNKARAAGVPIKQAVIESGTKRFRAIILTSFTTAAGLMPIMLESSVQAQYVIPMAISLSFGILFATFITLFLVPALYVLMRSWKLWILDREDPAPAAQADAPIYSIRE